MERPSGIAGHRPVTHLSATRKPWRLLLSVLAVVILSSACGGDEKPEFTLEEQLELIAGEPLTPVQIADRLNVASAICAMDDPLLDAVWRRLTDDQLAFQDFVIGRICPDRSVFYAGRTGRYVTEEAENSGVVTSTTRPPPTTTSLDDVGVTTTSGPSIFGTVTTSPDETEVTPPTTAAAGASGVETTTTTEAEAVTTPQEGEGG